MTRKGRYKLSAEATAQLLLVNAKRFGEEKGRETTRFRYSKETLRKLSRWERLSPLFLEELSDELLALGWVQIPISDTEFGAIMDNKVSAWPRIGPKRVADILGVMHPEELIADEYDDAFPDPESEDLLTDD